MDICKHCGKAIDEHLICYGGKLPSFCPDMKNSFESDSKTLVEIPKAIDAPIYTRYVGEGLHIFWVNPWSGKEEDLGCFMWPAHPIESTKQVEQFFESLVIHPR